MRSRQKIMDATLRVIEAEGFGAVSVAGVAEAAGVSRQTVYSIFGSREAMVSQALGDVAQEGMQEIEARLATRTGACDFVVELAVAGRAMYRAHPVLATLMVAESGNPLHDDDMMPRAVAVVTAMLGGLVERDARYGPVLDEVAEAVTRTALSIVLFDSARITSDDDLRAFLHRWLVPALERLVPPQP